MLIASVPVALGQSDKWKQELSDPETVLSINFNVARMYDGFKKPEKLAEVKAFFKQQHGIELSEVDLFQAFNSYSPKLGSDADSTTHTQVTFRKAKPFDAKSVGKMSGSTLTEERFGDRVGYQGDEKLSGTWGAIAINDRTLLFAVRRKMALLLESQDSKLPPEHVLSEFRMSDVDCCVTFSGGKKIKLFFEDSLGPQAAALHGSLDSFDLLKSGKVFINSRSEKALVVEIIANDNAAAKKLEIKLQELVKMGLVTLGALKDWQDRHVAEMSKRGNAEKDETLEKVSELYVNSISILKTLKFSVEGANLTISSSDPTAQRVPEMMVDFLSYR